MARVDHVQARPPLPSGRHGLSAGLFFLGDVLFADGHDTTPYLFDLREPYAPEEEDEQSEGKQDAN